MTTPTWNQAIVPTTQPEFVDLNLASLEAEGSKLNGWSDDSPQRALVEGESSAEAAASVNVASIAKAASPTTCAEAGRSWVGAKVSWFDITYTPAISAVWLCECIVDVAIAPFVVDASNASGIQAQAQDGTIFQCTQSAPVLFVGPGLSASLLFTARIPGQSGNVPVGSIDRLISAPSGLKIIAEADATPITVGANEESESALILRALGRWGVIFGNPNGTAGWTRNSFNFLIPHFGYDPTANPALSVTRWGIDDANPMGPGTVLVTLANPTGSATVAEVAAVTAGLNGIDVKPVGSGQLYVASAAAHALVINATLVTDGSNVNLISNATSALASLTAVFPLGPSTLTVDLVREILMGARLLTAVIPTGATYQTIPLSLPGFGGVAEVGALSLVVDETIPSGEVLELTVGTITVVT